MKPVTVDMLRAHLMAASMTAIAIEFLALIALLTLPVSQEALSSTPSRLVAIIVTISGVMAIRHRARVAFDLAVQRHHVVPCVSSSQKVLVTTTCPRGWLVVLHLRFTGRPFSLASIDGT